MENTVSTKFYQQWLSPETNQTLKQNDSTERNHPNRGKSLLLFQATPRIMDHLFITSIRQTSFYAQEAKTCTTHYYLYNVRFSTNSIMIFKNIQNLECYMEGSIDRKLVGLAKEEFYFQIFYFFCYCRSWMKFLCLPSQQEMLQSTDYDYDLI